MFYAPIVAILLDVGNVAVPINTLILSTVLFVVIQLLLGVVTRTFIIKSSGLHYFETVFLKKFDKFTIIGLLL